MKRIYIIVIIIILSFSFSSFSQGLFESATEPDTSIQKSMNYLLNGHVRGVYYTGGALDKDKIGTNSAYGELDFKLEAKKETWGDAFANFRYRYGHEYEKNVSELLMREAYVKVIAGKFDFLIGKKIIAWGRCDGFNPTDNLTPKNMIVRSPDDDDRRLGNFLLRAKYNVNPFTFEFNWIPVYRSSVMPYNMVELPEYVNLLDGNFPGSEMKNSSWAGRINMQKPVLGVSVSYFEGMDPTPGIDIVSVETTENSLSVNIQPRPYRTRIIGADFSTTAGSYSIRGEFAYRKALEDRTEGVYLPWPDIQYVLGIDRSFGDINFVFQYIGRYIIDYKEYGFFISPISPVDQITEEISRVNRKFNYQLDKFSHMLSIQPSMSLLHETLKIEFFLLFNFSTNEYLLRPKLTYDIGDAFKLSTGIEYYHGEEGKLFHILGDNLNGFFFELRASF